MRRTPLRRRSPLRRRTRKPKFALPGSKEDKVIYLDRLWQTLIMARDKNRCRLCGQIAYCGHHIVFKSRSHATRWELDNGIAVCNKCHARIHFGSPGETAVRIFQAIGDIAWARIHQLSKGSVQFNLIFIKRYQTYLEDNAQRIIHATF